MENPALIVSMNASEEEPGEGEKQDCQEEIKALPETTQFGPIPSSSENTPLPHNPVNSLELVQEVVLPPPEGRPLSPSEFSVIL
jgi:hypothetical protein